VKSYLEMPIDETSIEDIAANLALRLPNLEALQAVAARLNEASGEPIEVVLDLATAVGKTYIAAGLVDYVAAQGSRNVVIVVPSRPILNKTVANFSRGGAKSIAGRETAPMIITGDDFERGEVATALVDDSIVKLFIFTVQQLIKPQEKASRRVRDYREGLGHGLYEYLQSVGDLVVIADEHHAYYGPKFSQAIRELDAVALIGLTATPNKETPASQIIYRYPLGRAIADGLVKTPVLVGRKDDRQDVETQLSDGFTLLAAKRRAVEAWCAANPSANPVNPVMFIVCQTIEDANEVTEILRRPSFFGTEFDNAVLTIHSESSDEALEQLEKVEEPSSPVRAIVSVSMLKEGWDVKNIYVICALRALASQMLTEQTLGRGLRLPFGELTGVEMLDTVEVLGHDRYEELLRRAGVLIEGLVASRSAAPEVDPVSGLAPAAPTPPSPAGEPGSLSSNPSSEPVASPAAPGVSGPVLRVADATTRIADSTTQAELLSTVVQIDPTKPPFFIPQMHRTLRPGEFSLSDIADEDFRTIGQSLAATPDEVLRRSKIEVVVTDKGRLEVHPVAAVDKISAATRQLDLGQGKEALVQAMLDLGLVAAKKSEKNAAERLADALIEGLGNEAASRLSAFFNTVVDTVKGVLARRHRSVPAGESITVSERVLTVGRVNSRPVSSNHYEDFSRDHAYDNWTKSLVAIEWFDSSTERTMAVLLDEDPNIKRWIRLHRSDGLVINYEGQTYYPDFALEDTDGTYWLVETKADFNLESPEVLVKKKAAEKFARFATDSDQVTHKWRYLLVGETQLANAHGNWNVLLAQVGAK